MSIRPQKATGSTNSIMGPQRPCSGGEDLTAAAGRLPGERMWSTRSASGQTGDEAPPHCRSRARILAQRKVFEQVKFAGNRADEDRFFCGFQRRLPVADAAVTVEDPLERLLLEGMPLDFRLIDLDPQPRPRIGSHDAAASL